MQWIVSKDAKGNDVAINCEQVDKVVVNKQGTVELHFGREHAVVLTAKASAKFLEDTGVGAQIDAENKPAV